MTLSDDGLHIVIRNNDYYFRFTVESTIHMWLLVIPHIVHVVEIICTIVIDSNPIIVTVTLIKLT